MTAYAAPAPLADHHDLAGFDSGTPVLDAWLTNRARRNAKVGASRIFVVTKPGEPLVLGYYTLSAAEIAHTLVPGRPRRNMPDPIPAALIGRLAVDEAYQGKGLGRALLADAVRRTVRVAAEIGVRVLLVHALSDRAAAFYRSAGFAPLPGTARTLAFDLRLLMAAEA